MRATNSILSQDYKHLFVYIECIYSISVYSSALTGAVCVRVWLLARLAVSTVTTESCGGGSVSHCDVSLSSYTCFVTVMLKTIWMLAGIILGCFAENDVKQAQTDYVLCNNWAFSWVIIGVSVTLMEHSLIRASVLTSSYAEVCWVTSCRSREPQALSRESWHNPTLL